MNYDKRTALPQDHEFEISDQNTGNTYSVTIEKELGRGGSCIVYTGRLRDRVGNEQVTRSVIIKELYPKELDDVILRTETMDLKIPKDIQEKFQQSLDMFCAGQAKHIIYANDNAGSALPPTTYSGMAHNTFYAVSQRGQGNTLSYKDRQSLSLADALIIAASVCDAIHEIHARGMNLYLDCKPDNICVFENKAYLFDFDTVQPRGRFRFCSYSEGWSAPEQVFKDSGGYIKPQKIGFHTDVFSIGAVLFYLLVGRKPTGDDLDRIKDGYDWRAEITLDKSGDALKDESFVKELDRVMRSLLEQDPDARRLDFGDKEATAKVAHDFRHLLELAENAPYRRGFEDTNDHIDNAQNALENTIRDNSFKTFLFGSKKRILATVSVFLVIAAAFGVISSLGGKAAERVAYRSAAEIEPNMDAHLLLKLANANHQYEVGLENWRRLDYLRAERDICAARDEISGEKAQSELDVARINNSLGCLYIDMGKFREAYDYLNSAYVTFRRELGEDSLEARAVQASISQYYYNTGMLDEALTETQRILDGSDGAAEKAVIASASHLRAMVFEAQGRYDQALALYEMVLGMYGDIAADGKMSEQLANYANDPNLSQSEKEYYTNSIRWIILTYNNIAVANIRKGDIDAAIDAVNTGIGMSLSNIYIGRRNITTSKLYMNLAIAEGKQGNISDAIEDVDLAMRIQRNLFDFEDVFPGLVEVYDVYGSLLEIKGEPQKALEYYQDAVKLAVDSFGENHPDTASAYHALGNYLVRSGSAEEAVGYLESAIEIRKNMLAEDHPVTAEMYYDLAMAQRAMTDNAAAKESLESALRICDAWRIESGLRDEIAAALNG